ncbi:MAG: lipocalin family protein [Candidatus Lernaella stagnicola]|nr:lipocalin family protein [Candidatus Lernaella stagnicola]
MRKGLPYVLLAIMLVMAACEKKSPPSYTPPDASADRRAYEQLMPPVDAPEVNPENIPVKNLAAFNFAGIHFRNVLGWWYFNAHTLDTEGRRWSFMFAILSDNQFYGMLYSPDDDVFIPYYKETDTEVDRKALSASSKGVATIRQLERGRLDYEFELEGEPAQMKLRLTAIQPPIAVSGDGTISMGETGRSEYYLIPAMRVDGSVAVGDKRRVLHGLGWMDHQWGLWNYGKLRSWHWFSIHLTDGTKAMVFAFVRKDNTMHVDCDAVLPDGTHRPSLSCTAQTLSEWKSEATGRRRATVWRIDISELDASLTVTADRENMEVNETIYEGGAFVSGTRGGKKIEGRAFYEESQI